MSYIPSYNGSLAKTVRASIVSPLTTQRDDDDLRGRYEHVFAVVPRQAQYAPLLKVYRLDKTFTQIVTTLRCTRWE